MTADATWTWGDEVPMGPLPTCCICRKQSDGAQPPWPGAQAVDGGSLYVCGTHYDEWLRSAWHAKHGKLRRRHDAKGEVAG